MDPFLCIGRIGRCVERKHIRGLGGRIIGIRDSRGIFGKDQKRVWRGDKESVKVVELRRLEQEEKTIEEFV